jgi:predicted transcriptional regulator
MKRALLFMNLLCGALWLTANVGKQVPNVSLTDVNDNSQTIPFLGDKVLMVFYVDPDVEQLVNPLVEVIDEKKYQTTQFGAVGVVNCKDTWIPNQAILLKTGQKQLRYPKSVMLLDKNHIMAKAWNIDKSDNVAVVLIIGKDARVKYAATIETLQECKEAIPKVCKFVDEEIK